MKHLEILFKGGRVRRYHTESVIKEQNVAEHSWGVAIIVDRLWPDASKNLIMAALYHDTHEAELGDIPAPTKRLLSEKTHVLKEWENEFHEKTNSEHNLNPTDKARLKIADYLELVLFCQHEYKMGNSHLLRVELKGTYYVKEILSNNPSIFHNTTTQESIDQVCEILNIKGLA